MKKKDLLILIGSVLGIFLLVMLINGIYPFGKNDLAIKDAAAQYEPFLYDYITRLKNFNYTNYTFMNFLGNPAMFNFVYYLASPFNLIGLLFNNYKSMFLAVIILKLVIASVSAYYFFSKYDRRIGIIASLCYVYSGWFLAYYFNIMWLDGFMMFPLLVVGVQNVLKNKPVMYILSLSYIYISNFYIGYMLSFFVLVYYLFKLITMKETYYYKIRNFLQMMLYTGVVIGNTFFHIYNVYNIIGKTKLVTYNYTSSLLLKDFVTGLFFGNIDVAVVSRQDYANVCVSVFALLGALAYFFNKNIDRKEKIKSLCLVIILLVVLFSPKINYVIAGFTVPAGMPLRYSFIFSFFLIYLAVKNYISENVNYCNFLIGFTYAGLLIYCYVCKLINLDVFILNLVMSVIYFLYLVFHSKQFSKLIVLMGLLTELVIGLCINFKGTDVLKDSNFYSSSYSFSYFSSMTYREPLNFVGGLGVSTDYKSRVTETSGVISEILQNKVFGANKDIINFRLDDDFVDNQNTYIESLTGISHVISKGKYKVSVNDNVVTYKVKEDGRYYYTLSSNQFYILWKDKAYIATDDEKILPSNYKSYSIYNSVFSSLLVFDLKNDDEVIICYSDDNYHDLFVLDEVLFKDVTSRIEKYSMKYAIKKDNYLKGTVVLDDNMLIYTTIPYDSSWKIKLDGKYVKPVKLEGGLIGVIADAGEHTLEFKYDDIKSWPFVVSLLSLGGFMIIIKKHYKENL